MVEVKAKGHEKVASAASSRWGIGLVSVAFMLIWIWLKPVGFQKSTASLVVSMIVGPMSVVLTWPSAHELGKQWRFEAAVSADHKLIQTGPYDPIRHPLYVDSLRSRHPLRAVGEVTNWQGHPPEQLQHMRDSLERLKAEGAEIID